MSADPVADFSRTIAAAGLPVPDSITADGALHRFSTNGRASDKSGWFVLHGDALPAGSFGCWRSGVSETWCAKSDRQLTPAERAENRARIETMRQQREAEETRVRGEARDRAAEIWQAAEPASASHAYLVAKQIAPHNLREHGGELVAALRDADGTLHSLQTIAADGKKLFLSGGRTKACYHAIGAPGDVVLIAEGIATAASLNEATGHACAAAFSASNLRPAAEALRGKFPRARLIVCADDDPNGRGLEAAREAAAAVGGLVALPDFGDNRPDGLSDFNDLAARHAGPAAVRACIASATFATFADWPEPQSLPELPTVDAFDPALLPDVLRPWAMDIADRVQCPPDYVAATLMAALAAVIGRTLAIRPQAQTDWTVTPNLWGLLVGRPGVLKSPAMEAALAPLKRLAALAVETHEAAMTAHRGEALATKLRAEEAEKSARAILRKTPGADVAGLLTVAEPVEPTLRRWLANDTTAAALGELLRQNPNGLLVHRDEMVSLLRSLDREDMAEARGFYLTAWNGDSGYTFDRIGRGFNLHIPAVCLSLIGSTQPARLADYVRAAVRGGAGDDGLIQRFGLLVWPDASGTWRNVDRWPDGEARRTAHAVFERLAGLRPETLGAAQERTPDGKPDGPAFLRLDPAALSQFTGWREDLERRLRSGDLHPALESHLAKYRKLIPALALICHVTDGGTGPVSEGAMLRALAWGDYLESHARRAYGSATAPGLDAARGILRRIHRGDLPAEFSSRDVWRPGWSGLADAETVRPGLALLADLGWLRESHRETGGRTATVYTVHPEARK